MEETIPPPPLQCPERIMRGENCLQCLAVYCLSWVKGVGTGVSGQPPCVGGLGPQGRRNWSIERTLSVGKALAE